MYIGLGIGLLLVGAIFTFAIPDSHPLGINLVAVGWICMLAGLLAIILSLVMDRSRRARGFTQRRVTRTDPTTGEQIDEVQDRRY